VVVTVLILGVGILPRHPRVANPSFLLIILSVFFAYLIEPLVQIIRRPFEEANREKLYAASAGDRRGIYSGFFNDWNCYCMADTARRRSSQAIYRQSSGYTSSVQTSSINSTLAISDIVCPKLFSFKSAKEPNNHRRHRRSGNEFLIKICFLSAVARHHPVLRFLSERRKLFSGFTAASFSERRLALADRIYSSRR
jgi:hypothetical protein